MNRNEKIESLRSRLTAQKTIAEQLQARADSYRAAPHAATNTTVQFAKRLLGELLLLVGNALTSVSKAADTTDGTTVAVELAVAERIMCIVSDQLRMVESCLEGEMTIDGKPIKHGPLWYK